MRQENVDIKNVLNNINLQISKFLPSSTASSVSDIEITKTFLKSTKPIKPVLKVEEQVKKEQVKKEQVIVEPIKEPIILVSEDEQEETDSEDESIESIGSNESEVDTTFFSD